MIDTISLRHGPGARRISYDKDPEWVAITAGEESYISEANIEYGSTMCHVLIGRYCSIAHRVIFEVGLNHDYRCATTYPFDDIEVTDPKNINHSYAANKYQIVIGNDVWIGCDVIIMGGVHIGNGAVIGAGAVVAKDVPPYAVVVGNPARVIKYRFEPEVIQRLQEIKWWYWPVEKIKAKYPLMKYMDIFLKDCEDIHFGENEDELVGTLKLLKADGYYIYYMVADYQLPDAIWHRVLAEYLQSFSETSKVLLVVEVTDTAGNGLETEMAKMIEARGEDAPVVVTHKSLHGVSLGLFRLVDIFITTKDISSSVVVDFMSDMDGEIVFGLDHGGHIFGDK